MNFALIIDAVPNVDSYYIKNNKAYDFNNNPISYNHSIGNECFLNTWNYPWLFENGYFINWNEYKYDLPDLDLDLIFLVKERSLAKNDGHYDGWCEVENIRKKYPNSKIVGFIKEIWMGPPYDYEHPKHKARIDFLNECDSVITNRPQLKEFQQIADNVNKPFNFVAQPHNIDYFYENFGGDKDLAIWAYLPNPIDRRGLTYDFVNYIGNKYNIEVRYKQLENGQQFDYLSQKDFCDMWSKCLFHFNLDPIDYFPGNQITQVVSTGTIHIGGVNDNHRLLSPETATNDTKILEEKFVQYLKNEKERNRVIRETWDRLNKYFSFKSVREQINNINYDLEKGKYNMFLEESHEFTK